VTLQILNVLGACCILASFVTLKLGKLPQESFGFNFLSGVGALLLGYVAVNDHRYGWIVLESVYCVFSARAIYQLYKPSRFIRGSNILDSDAPRISGS